MACGYLSVALEEDLSHNNVDIRSDRAACGRTARAVRTEMEVSYSLGSTLAPRPLANACWARHPAGLAAGNGLEWRRDVPVGRGVLRYLVRVNMTTPVPFKRGRSFLTLSTVVAFSPSTR